jgi:hypothetical protein
LFTAAECADGLSGSKAQAMLATNRITVQVAMFEVQKNWPVQAAAPRTFWLKRRFS